MVRDTQCGQVTHGVRVSGELQVGSCALSKAVVRLTIGLMYAYAVIVCLFEEQMIIGVRQMSGKSVYGCE